MVNRPMTMARAMRDRDIGALLRRERWVTASCDNIHNTPAPLDTPAIRRSSVKLPNLRAHPVGERVAPDQAAPPRRHLGKGQLERGDISGGAELGTEPEADAIALARPWPLGVEHR